MSRRLSLVAAGLALAVANRWLARRAMLADLRDQVVLITGSSRGLGLALAHEFGRAGSRLVICGRQAATLEAAAAELRRQGYPVLAEVADVAERPQIERLVAMATAHYGRIDILVNNAATLKVGPLATMTAADFDAAQRIIFGGTLNTILAVLPQMRQRRAGRIVNITSIGGRVSVPHLLPYSSAKFATVGLSTGLRAELAREGIVVTTIVPGLMRTGSPVNAVFAGQPAREFAWFAASDSLPGLSISAERAAAQIVAATRRGEAVRTLTWPANLLAAIGGLAPGLTADTLALVNRGLPSAEPATMSAATGDQLIGEQPAALQPLLRPLTAAADTWNQTPTPPPADQPAAD